MNSWVKTLSLAGLLLFTFLAQPSSGQAGKRKRRATKRGMGIISKQNLPSCIRMGVCKNKVDRVCHILAIGDSRESTARGPKNVVWAVVRRQECSKRCVRKCSRSRVRALKACKQKIKQCQTQYNRNIKTCRAKARKRCKPRCKRTKDRSCLPRCAVREMKRCLLPFLKQKCPRHPRLCRQQIEDDTRSCRLQCCTGSATTHVCEQTYQCKCKVRCLRAPCRGCVCSCEWPVCRQVSFSKTKSKKKSKAKRKKRR
ncbi:MAG: hypothetical protein EP343_33175 [Deltaproteobacteria bacterium]|nr:MAG: hypothetical protein EP343_33175 [Deltaproteobacteria bacterium]